MNQVNSGETSSNLSIHPLKRRRGRPRKDPTLKPTKPAQPPHPPGFQKPDKINSMVGQAVTGIVEATFDAGYLLTVRIGNSTTNLRGLVFKPGHYVPVTSENDIAPNLPMIGRNVVNSPHPENNLAIQTVRQKRKYVRKAAAAAASSAVPPVGVRGTVVPVVLQPVFPSGPTQMPSTGHLMDFGDKDVRMVEPLAILPPDRSIPVGQIFLAHTSQQVSQTNGNETEKVKTMESSDVDNIGSSETSDSGKEDLGFVPKDTGNTKEPFSTESLFNYGKGRMTELLQAVQENMKEKHVQIAEPRMTETHPQNEATAP